MNRCMQPRDYGSLLNKDNKGVSVEFHEDT